MKYTHAKFTSQSGYRKSEHVKLILTLKGLHLCFDLQSFSKLVRIFYLLKYPDVQVKGCFQCFEEYLQNDG